MAADVHHVERQVVLVHPQAVQHVPRQLTAGSQSPSDVGPRRREAVGREKGLLNAGRGRQFEVHPFVGLFQPPVRLLEFLILAGDVSLHPPDLLYDPEQLRAAFDQGPKAIILCNPSNPSGKVFTRSELEFIADLSKEHDAFVITDEVYEHIVYRPYRHRYMAALPEMFDRTISCSSLSKTYNMTGWRLGYVIGPESVIAGARKVHDFLTVGAAAPLQEAAVAALQLPESYYEQLTADYTHKKELFLTCLDEAGLSYTEPQGAYYVMVDTAAWGVENDTEFCRWMAREVGVAAVPGSSFFHEPVNHLIRFHFSRSDAVLSEIGKRLQKLKALI